VRRIPALAATAATALTVAVQWRLMDVAVLAFSPDSAIYLGAADGIRHGHWLTAPFSSGLSPVPLDTAMRTVGQVPLGWCPPGFPAVLAAVETATGARGGGALRIVDVLAIVGISIGAWRIGRHLAEDRVAGFLAVTAAMAVVGLGPFLQFGTADPCLTFAVLVVVERGMAWWQHPRVSTALAWGCAGAACAALKFQGEYVLAPIALSLLLARHVPRHLRLRSAAAAVGPGLGITLLWMAVAPGPPRRLGWHPPTTFGLVDIVTRPLALLSPTARADVVGVGCFVVAVSAVALLARARVVRNVLVPAMTAWALPPFLALAAATVDDDTGPRDPRLLLPTVALLAVLMAAGLAGMIAAAGRRRPRRLLRVAATTLVGVAVVACSNPFVHRSVYLLGDYSVAEQIRSGLSRHPRSQLRGRLDEERRLSPLVSLVPPRTVIFSDAPEQVWLETGRPAIAVPERFGRTDRRPTPGLDRQLWTLRRTLAAGRGVYVWCHQNIDDAALPPQLGLEQVADTGPCGLWQTPAPMLR
jgi:hypothetical protein